MQSEYSPIEIYKVIWQNSINIEAMNPLTLNVCALNPYPINVDFVLCVTWEGFNPMRLCFRAALLIAFDVQLATGYYRIAYPWSVYH